jgi:hypothetical protein
MSSFQGSSLFFEEGCDRCPNKIEKSTINASLPDVRDLRPMKVP